MSLYNADGQINLTTVSGSTWTGIQAADGSYNIVINDGSTRTGLYHPCGAFNAVVISAPNGFYYASNGSMNVVANNFGSYSPTQPMGISSGVNLNNYLFYTAFPGSAGVLNGTNAEKGGAWATTGTGALNLNLTGTGGVKMSNNTTVAYAYNNAALTAPPQWLSAGWKFTTTIDVPIAVAFMTNTTFNTGKALHVATSNISGNTNWSTTLLDEAAVTFTPPAWNVSGPTYVLLANEAYTIDLYYQGNFSKVTLKDHTGTIVMSQTLYDPDMLNYVGLYFFFEHLNTSSIVTNKISVASSLPNGWTWPTISPLTPNGATGWSLITDFVNSPFGGTATQGSGKVTIAGTTFGAGGAKPLGALTTSDKIWFSIDASNFSGTTDNRFYVTLTDGSGATANIVTCTSNGRFQGVLTPTNNNSQSFLICGTNLVGDPTFSVDISSKFLLLKNAPTVP